MHPLEIFALARKHLDAAIAAKRDFFQTSSEYCLQSALDAYSRGDGLALRRWALKSLAYSIGIAHPDYRRAAADSR
jgi:hypothetical protein